MMRRIEQQPTLRSWMSPRCQMMRILAAQAPHAPVEIHNYAAGQAAASNCEGLPLPQALAFMASGSSN